MAFDPSEILQGAAILVDQLLVGVIAVDRLREFPLGPAWPHSDQIFKYVLLAQHGFFPVVKRKYGDSH